MALNPPSDPAFFLDDGATTYAPGGGGTQTVYGKVGGVARIVDLGADPWIGFAAFQPTVLDLSSDENYQLTIEASNTADFSGAKQDLVAWPLLAMNPQDLVVVNNVYDGTTFRYVRLKITMMGTTPQIRLSSFVKEQSDVEETSLAEALTKMALLTDNTYQAYSNFRAWMSGVAGGGPNSDGRYFLSDGMGNSVLVKCPAQIAADATSGSSLDGVYFFTQLNTVTIPLAVRVIKTAGYSSIGVGVAEYTVGDVIPPPTALAADTPSRRHSANRRPINLIVRREVNVNAMGGNEAALTHAATLVYDAGGAANKIMVMDAVQILIQAYKNFEKMNLDLFAPGTIRAGNDIGLPTPSADPNFTTKGLPISTYKQGDPHVSHEIDQTVIGPIIDIGGNPPSVNAPLVKRLWLIGRSANQLYPTVAFRIRDDQRANTRYELGVSDHKGDGLELKDDTEKKDILLHCLEVRGGYCLTLRSTQTETFPPDGGPSRWGATKSIDEVKVRYVCTANDKLYYGMDGVQASITHDCLVEALTPGAGKYASMVMTRKSEKWQGEVRGCTGRFMWVGTRTDGYTSGGCHMHFADFTLIQLLNGNVYIANPKNLTGRIVFNYAKTDDADEDDPLTDEATMTIGSVRGYCNLTVEMRRCTSPAGLDIGDENYLGPVRTGSDHVEEVQDIGLSFDNHTINVAIEMGSFEGSGGDLVAANTLWALRLRAGVNSIVNCSYLAGNIKIFSGWQRGLINVPAAWVRSGGSVTINPLASTEMAVHGPMDLAEVMAIPWKFKGLKILTVNDFDGMGLQYNGSIWVPLAPVNVPEVSLAALGSPYNDPAIKRKGMALLNLGDAWPYFATGPARADAWQYHGGTIPPDYLDVTGEFETRAIAAGSGAFTDPMRLAFDRFFHDLIAAGVYTSDQDTSIMKAFWAMMGPNMAIATTNMLFDDWELDTFGSMGHEPTIGLVPPDPATGAYSQVKDWVTFPHGTTKYNIAIIGGSEQLLDSDASADLVGGPFFSFGSNASGNWRGTFHRLDGGNYSQLLTEDALASPPIDSTIPYRIGMAWSPDGNSQSIFMYGGQPVSSTKTLADEPMENIYFGRARVGAAAKYLPTSLSFGGIASGAVTNEQAGAILRSINTLRSALKLL